MIDEQIDRGTIFGRRRRLGSCHCIGILLRRGSPFAVSTLNVPIKLDEKKRLILDVREEVVVANEVKDSRSAETEVKRKSFARLAV
jgi:hypothetical protein